MREPAMSELVSVLVLWDAITGRAAPPAVVGQALLDGGLKRIDIAEATDVTPRTVRRWLQPDSSRASRPRFDARERLENLHALVTFMTVHDVPPQVIREWLRAERFWSGDELLLASPLQIIARGAHGDFSRAADAADYFAMSRKAEQYELLRSGLAAASRRELQRDTPKAAAPVAHTTQPATSPRRRVRKRVFISYVREDSQVVGRICEQLLQAGLPLWRDTDDLVGGTRWRDEIGQAISAGSAFVAMFSSQSERRSSSYMRQEVVVAVDELRRRPRDRPWFIPVRLDACELPTIEIGAGERLSDLHCLDVFDPEDAAGIANLISAAKAALRRRA
jgi:hypothetical protein